MNILADFREISPEAASGIYAFVSEDYNIIYYIGQSVNILNRYRGHSVKQFLTSKGIKFKFIWRECLKKLLDKQETEYITKLKPLLNTILNWDVSNELKDEYREYVNSSISKAIKSCKDIREVELKSIIEAKKCKQKSRNLSKSAIEARVNALRKAIELGEMYLNIKNLIKSAPNKGEVVTDMGTFKGWRDFLEKNNLVYETVRQYIFMYEHEREFEELKLLSLDPNDIACGASGHRKIAACDAVKWYLKLIKEKGEGVRGTVTAADYQAHKSKMAEVGTQYAAQAVDSITLKLPDYFSLMSELFKLRSELEELKAKQTAKV